MLNLLSDCYIELQVYINQFRIKKYWGEPQY
nr:MAG TPA: hypothetical protein [Caudoviricetes sp.]